jgi:hypothetical protein
MAVHHPERLVNVHPDLVRLVEDVGADHEIAVQGGARTVEEEQRLIDAGVSHLKDPRDSLHVIDALLRPEALAVDLTFWPAAWNDKAAFVRLGALVKSRAAALGITPFSWGGDWPRPFDFDHFQRAPAPV